MFSGVYLVRLTDRKITGLKPKKYEYDLREKDGFLLRVYPSGRKVFQFVFRQEGKERRVSIGEYPVVYSLKSAREKHAELYALLKRGASYEEVSGQESEVGTVSKLAERYLEEYSKVNNTERAYKDHRRMLDNDVLPIIGKMTPEKVKRIHVQTCLKRCLDRNAPVAHNHTLNVIRKMFNWAIEQGLIENNPAYLIKAKATSEKSRVLTDKEIQSILKDRSTDSAKILILILLTGARPGECQGMRYEDIDGDSWTCKQIKGGKSSEKKTYLVPAALELIGSGSGLVFPAQQTQNGIARFVKRKYHLKGADNWTPHDIRRTVSTRLIKMGFSNEHVSALLGHSFGKLNRTYMVYDYEKEKKAMLLAWEKELNKIKKKKLPSPGGRVSDISET